MIVSLGHTRQNAHFTDLRLYGSLLQRVRDRMSKIPPRQIARKRLLGQPRVLG